MKNKAVFLDRDGTINVDYGYVYKSEDFQFIEGAVEALKMIQSNGFQLIIITNQSGISRGYYSREDFLNLHRQVDRVLSGFGVHIDGLYFCPHLDGKCDCRKPATKLFYQAASEHQIDFSTSFAIGDSMRDLSICKKENTKGFLLTNCMRNDNRPPFNRIECCSGLLEAAKRIISSQQ